MQSFDELYAQLLNWHRAKHQFAGDNTPSLASEQFLAQLTKQILLPVTEHFGTLTVTYGFTGSALSRYIQRLSPAGTAPGLDQHACCELNSRNSLICERQGAACDFIVQGYEQRMHLIAQFICQQLSFDKLYFYGRDRPIHISVSDEPLRHFQVMQQSANDRRYPGKKAFGDSAIALAKEL
ncbi:hypothetical protein ORJ00_07920 [Rheinheimera baltica]|uniref:hypothetical protein n=1 Tax=Rheinheimera baltica TaxID=67576 RepID=UPI00273F01C8|nr:hypothetical protein [Rheinheimera baltica]MDP5142661.1 hypothetical protein [Rheinheimera baltica]